MLNRSINGGKSDIVKLNSDFTGETVGSADIVVRDNFMFLSVPRSAVGLSNLNFIFLSFYSIFKYSKLSKPFSQDYAYVFSYLQNLLLNARNNGSAFFGFADGGSCNAGAGD